MATEKLRHARELYLSEQRMSDDIRQDISHSWIRSNLLQIRPDRLNVPYVREPDLDSPLVRAAEPVIDKLACSLSQEQIGIMITSADGTILNRLCAKGELIKALDAVWLAPGFSYSEEMAGTNGIGTALETRKSILVQGGEHYVDSLAKLACAGVPIVHPVSGALAGLLDLTGWSEQGGPLLKSLAETAATQIENRLLSQSSAAETTLMFEYLRARRRAPQLGVVAIFDDIFLMSKRLRITLDASDQLAIHSLAVESIEIRSIRQCAITLPSGRTARLTRVSGRERGAPERSALFYVHLSELPDPPAASVSEFDIPADLAGSSASWRRSCQNIASCVRNRQWIAVAGEKGSGRTAALKSIATRHIPGYPSVIESASLVEDRSALQTLRKEITLDGFSIILRNVDSLDTELQRKIAGELRGREHAGWIGATVESNTLTQESEVPLLSSLTCTVAVPALRHRIDDIHDLVPRILAQVSPGLSLSPAAMRQLCRYSWPGNVSELRAVLLEVGRRQRSGVVAETQLPPACRTLSRRTLTRIESLERDAIIRSLEDHAGNKKSAAADLGMSRATIYRKMKEFGIEWRG